MKVNHDLLHVVLQVNQSKNCHWNPREKTAIVILDPRVVHGAMQPRSQGPGNEVGRNALWRKVAQCALLNAMHSGKKFFIYSF